MTLIKVKKYHALDIKSLVRFVLKFIYEPKNMRNEEIDFMWESIKIWKNHFKYKIEIGLSQIDKEQQIVLLRLLQLLDDNFKGKLEGRKELVRKHKLDYRRLACHRLPEAYTHKELVQAAAMKKEYDKNNKEQEGLI